MNPRLLRSKMARQQIGSNGVVKAKRLNLTPTNVLFKNRFSSSKGKVKRYLRCSGIYRLKGIIIRPKLRQAIPVKISNRPNLWQETAINIWIHRHNSYINRTKLLNHSYCQAWIKLSTELSAVALIQAVHNLSLQILSLKLRPWVGQEQPRFTASQSICTTKTCRRI